jgi:hypothetical protein
MFIAFGFCLIASLCWFHSSAGLIALLLSVVLLTLS